MKQEAAVFVAITSESKLSQVRNCPVTLPGRSTPGTQRSAAAPAPLPLRTRSTQATSLTFLHPPLVGGFKCFWERPRARVAWKVHVFLSLWRQDVGRCAQRDSRDGEKECRPTVPSTVVSAKTLWACVPWCVDAKFGSPHFSSVLCMKSAMEPQPRAQHYLRPHLSPPNSQNSETPRRCPASQSNQSPHDTIVHSHRETHRTVIPTSHTYRSPCHRRLSRWKSIHD